MRTFGSRFGCREASFRLGLKAELLETLRELTTAPAEEVARKAREALPPSASTVSVHLVVASADGRAKRPDRFDRRCRLRFVERARRRGWDRGDGNDVSHHDPLCCRGANPLALAGALCSAAATIAFRQGLRYSNTFSGFWINLTVGLVCVWIATLLTVPASAMHARALPFFIGSGLLGTVAGRFFRF